MECPEFLKPRLRLFLSADIVGSTALKQSKLGAFHEAGAKNQSSWFSVIQGFYIEARRHFLEGWNNRREANSAHPELFGELPVVWKTIGDEVLFVKVLTDHRQLAVCLECWIAAVRDMRHFLKRLDPRLDVKCAAWSAGFPFKNKEVVISSLSYDTDRVIDDYYLENGRLLDSYYRGGTPEIDIDFIGPSIDIGFRLASFATNRKFIVGVDIAYMMALTTPSHDKLIPAINLYYGGSHALKGVFGGVDYPVFWIDMSDREKLPHYEDLLTGTKSVNRDFLQSYCEAFYREYASYTFRPFIRSESEQQIREEPPEYDEVLRVLTKNFTLAQVQPVEPQDANDPVVADDASVEKSSCTIIDELTSDQK